MLCERVCIRFRKVILTLCFYFYSIILVHLKKNDEAIKSWNKAIKIKPNYVEAYFNLGNFFFDGSVHWFMALYKYGTLGYPNPNVLNENLDSRHK